MSKLRYYSLFNFSFLIINFHLIFGQQFWTNELCQTYDKNQLYPTTNTILSKLDSILVPNYFSKVVDGYFIPQIVDEEDGASAGGGTNMFGFYGTVFLPGEDVLPPGMCSFPGAFGSPLCMENGLTESFAMGPNDVLAIATCTPPEVKYFSYDLIISTRLSEEYPFYPGQYFGDTINDYVVSTSTSSPYDSPVLILHSGDKNSAGTVYSAATKSGLMNEQSINIRGIDTTIVKFWNRSESADWHVSRPDLLAFISRVSNSATNITDAAYNAFKNTSWPIRYYFAPDNPQDLPYSPAPFIQKLKNRYSSNVINEWTVYSNILNQLTKNIATYYESTYNSSMFNWLDVSYTMPGFYDDWDYILNIRKDNTTYVAGDRDAIYGIAMNESVILHENMSVVVIGIIHAKVLHSSFSSVGLDVMSRASNYTTMTESLWWTDEQLIGSAKRFFLNQDDDQEDALIDDLYVLEFFPPNSGRCQSAENPLWCREFNLSSFPFPKIMIGERAYGVKETTIGPCTNTTIPIRGFLFTNTF